jgi:ABC transport system ATP-binding/permease protein
MSERILKALMQLFAIIARPESNAEERRSVVGSFLRQQLNIELVNEYLKVFNNYYDQYQVKQTDSTLRKKRIAGSSVKVLKICTEINEELTQKQKVIVLLRLLEFIKSDSEVISEQELEFVESVADTFHIISEEYVRLKAFVLYSFNEIPNSSRMLFVDSDKEFSHPKVKHLYRSALQGQLRIFHVRMANMFLLKYLGEKELYLNGQLIQLQKIYVFSNGSSIRSAKISPIYYSDVLGIFNEDKIKSKIIFEAKNIEYAFKGGGIGLHKMNFTEESGHLVGIMGASGAGKTTLLNVLNGSYQPTTGEVLINDKNIYSENKDIEGLIGYVSQDDLLIEDLTVFQNLYYNAKLCFGNLSEFQIIRLVLKTLQSLGLYKIKNMKVGSPMNKKISGGQRKRLNIALELIREPSILFLDEPTSGLSSRDSENILDLLKDLALKGKLVFVVIHQPSSDIFKMFDKLLILDTGGYLIYDGDPVDSIIYFKSRTHQANWSESECPTCGNVNPEQIFNIVEAHVLDEYGNMTQTRRISPKEWLNQYEENSTEEDGQLKEKSQFKLPESFFKVPGKLKQFKVFVIRDVLSKLSNTQYLLINLLEAPLLACLLSYIIKYYNVDVATNDSGYKYSENSNMPVFIFMSVIISIFVGLTVSAEEIFRDRKIRKREKYLNLSWGSYLFSKVAILMFLSAIQAILFVVIGNSILEIRGMYWQYWLVLFSAWVFSNILGLNISDAFNSAVTIYILIPFLVIPQLILSGIIVKFDKLNPDISSPSEIPMYGQIITARWAYEALAVYQFRENKYEKQFYPYDKICSYSNFKKDFWLRTLRNKAAEIKRVLKDPKQKEVIENNLILLRNEISTEIRLNRKVKLPIKVTDLVYNKMSINYIGILNTYFDDLNQYYIQKYNKASEVKDGILSQQQNSDEKKQKFIQLKKDYHNEDLSDLVKNVNEAIKIVEYENHLYQKADPIFFDPQGGLLSSHFYAPRKKVFGTYFDTFWVNIIVIWVMSIFMFVCLYFNLLRKLLEIGEGTSDKIKKKRQSKK